MASRVSETPVVEQLSDGLAEEAHIAPAPVRALRELVRYRAKLARWRSSIKSSVHAVDPAG